MRSFWRTSRAQNAAVAFLEPLISQSRVRHGPILDQTWRDPYMIGFLIMLITLVAKHRSGSRLDSQELGLTQMAAWQKVTGLHDDRIGEEICLLSADGDEDFLRGCANAARYLQIDGRLPGFNVQALDLAGLDEMMASAMEMDVSDAEIMGDARMDSHGPTLWARCFEDHLR